MNLRLGLDTGGTYTDAVLVDEHDRIVAAHKRLTTHHDLAVGLAAAVDALPATARTQVRLVCLSTTLATNAVVEGRGAPVAVLLAGYDDAQVRQSGMLQLVPADCIVRLRGGHTALGEEREALDEAAADTAIAALAGRVSAFAVSAAFGVRNPAHERRLRQRVLDLTGKPVACGHELAHGLGAPQRAFTTVLNARLIPSIRSLIDALTAMLDDCGIHAPLMVVKGDGSLINLDTALRKPVGTVLSGPAASVLGARALSGARDAIIADIGGTTTDVAILRNGEPALSSQGARIGDTRPMVDAIRVISVGLGADSEARFLGGRGLVVGPRRVVPMSLLAHTHPHVLEAMQRQWAWSPDARNNRFVVAQAADAVQLASLGSAELKAWDALQAGPVELATAAFEDRELARGLGRLERRGLARYSGFTPSDAAHVLGFCDHWHGEAAELAARIWARQMRHVYGLGDWAAGDAHGPSRAVIDTVLQALARTLVDAGLHLSDTPHDDALTGMLTQLLLANTGTTPIHVGFSPSMPLIGVGAPAASLFPELARRTTMALKLPEHGNVANAYGAVMGQVEQRVRVTVSQPTNGAFRVYHHGPPIPFDNLPDALARAEAIARQEAADLAHEAGATVVSVRTEQAGNHVDHDIDGELFLDTEITAIAHGPAIDPEASPLSIPA